MLNDVMSMLSQGIAFLGGALIVFGLINLGMTIKDGMQGGGGKQGGYGCLPAAPHEANCIVRNAAYCL